MSTHKLWILIRNRVARAKSKALAAGPVQNSAPPPIQTKTDCSRMHYRGRNSKKAPFQQRVAQRNSKRNASTGSPIIRRNWDGSRSPRSICKKQRRSNALLRRRWTSQAADSPRTRNCSNRCISSHGPSKTTSPIRSTTNKPISYSKRHI